MLGTIITESNVLLNCSIVYCFIAFVAFI